MKKKEKKTEKAEKKLRAATRAWVKRVEDTFVLDDHHVMLLQLAGRAWDRALDARDEIAKNGLTYKDRFGQPHASPACKLENDSSVLFARLLRELALDVEPPGTPRPPAIGE